jgi:two-component sensor histidine kinase
MLSRADTGLTVPMKSYLEDLLASVMGSVAMPGVDYRVSAEPIDLPAKKAVAAGIIVNETVTNAVKHGFSSGGVRSIEVILETLGDGTRARLTIANTGTTLPADFDVTDTSTLGMQLISGLVEQLSGRLTVSNEPRTAFVVEFPC